MKRSYWLAAGAIFSLVYSLQTIAAEPATDKKQDLAALTWTDPTQAAAEDPDFSIQGEYGYATSDAAFGVQVVALGGGSFDAYLLEGGLPGLGWTRQKSRTLLTGTRTDEGVRLASEDQMTTAIIQNGVIKVTQDEKVIAELPRVERQSPTLGAPPSTGAIVLFDGTHADAWKDGVVENGLLANKNATTKDAFNDYSLHLEFRTPYKPYARGQARGNSGVYHQGRYETQVLDSFGLTGEMNETGGIYSIAAPRLNMCLPPLTWQTYDVDFTAAKFDTSGTMTQPAKITVRLNGILVHYDQELPKTTAAAPVKKITPEPGPLYLQHHSNPIYYRNIWLVRKNSVAQTVKPKKLLVVTITTGFRHAPAIEAAERVLPELAANSHGELEFEFLKEPGPRPNAGPVPNRKPNMTDEQWTETQTAYDINVAKVNAELPVWTAKVKELFEAKFSSSELEKYDGVIFCNTTGDLPLPDGNAFVNWISKGKAFIGMHAATDTLKGMPPYYEMINGSFAGHPWGANGTHNFVNHEPTHPVVAMFDPEFRWKDEIYQYNRFNPASVHVLISLDMTKSKPQAPYYVPVTWVRNIGSGRLFYTSLGHNAASWENETYQKHILAGMRWTLNLADGSADPNPDVATQHSLKCLVVAAGSLLQKDAGALEKKAMAKALRDPLWAARIAAEADNYRTMTNRDANKESTSEDAKPGVSNKLQLLTKLIEEIER